MKRLTQWFAEPRRTARKTAKALDGTLTALHARLRRVPAPPLVVMFHVGRSGSTVLGDMLDQHPQVYWDGEIYERVLRAADGRPPHAAEGVSPRVAPDALVADRMKRAGRRHYGLEVKEFHLQQLGTNLHSFVSALRARGQVQFLVLERRNYLRKIVSSVIARRTGSFHQPAERKARMTPVVLDGGAVQVDRQCTSLAELLEQYQRFFHRLDEELSGAAVLKLSYEEDVATDPFRGYQRVCGFLGLRDHVPSVRYGKSNPFSLRALLRNFSEVEQSLRGSPFEWMLYE